MHEEQSHKLVICCDNLDQIVGTIDKMMPKLCVEDRRKMDRIVLKTLQDEGKEGLYRRCQNQTIGYVLDTYGNEAESRVILRGEKDGAYFELSGE